MTRTEHVGAERSWLTRIAPVGLVIGGLSMAVLFVPFTLAHGPTSYNEAHHVLGWDMHRWGFVLGVVPNVLIAGGLWGLRRRITGGRPAATAVLAIACGALVLDALANLAFRALGPPLALVLLVPTTIALAALMPPARVPGLWWRHSARSWRPAWCWP